MKSQKSQPAPVKSNDLKELKTSSNVRYGVATKLENKHSDGLSAEFHIDLEARTAEVHVSEDEAIDDYMQDDIPIDEDDGSEISDNYENFEETKQAAIKKSSSDISIEHSDDMNMGDDEVEENEEGVEDEEFEEE